MDNCDCLNNEYQIECDLNMEAQVDGDIKTDEQLISTIEGVVEVSRQYKGLETEDIIVDVDNDKYTISARIRPIQYNSIAEFPNIGSERLIYVALDENATYIWEQDKLKYTCTGRDYTEIEVIDGGRA